MTSQKGRDNCRDGDGVVDTLNNRQRARVHSGERRQLPQDPLGTGPGEGFRETANAFTSNIRDGRL